MEFQVGRIVSDVESEKDTRSREHSRIHQELEKIRDVQGATNRILYLMLGGIGVIQVLIQFIRH